MRNFRSSRQSRCSSCTANVTSRVVYQDEDSPLEAVLVSERMVIQSWQQAEQQTAVIDATNVSQQLLE